MLSMMKRHEIQVLAKAKHTHKEIAEIAGVSSSSVERVLKEAPVEHVDDRRARRQRRVGRPSKVEAFRELVQKTLKSEPTLPSVELLRRARGKGYDGGKSAFYAMVRELRPSKSKLLVRFEAVPGEFSQHDFGEVKVTYLDGTTERVVFFATRMKFSRWVQVSLVPDQTAETLVRTTCEHFAAIGGRPLLAVFDRPKTVALKWKKDGTITKYNPIFAQAMFDMGVGAEVCWPYSPQQKGAVENLVGWVKGSFFKVRRFLDRADLEEQLRAWHEEVNHKRPSRATGVPPRERMATERARLRPLKVQPNELAVRKPFRVGPTARVSLDGRTYSMPAEAAGLSGTAWLYPDHVRLEAGRHVVEHDRVHELGGQSILPAHRASRLAATSGRRAKQYLKRQDIFELGDIALIFFDELVHRHPKTWFRDVDQLHDLLQLHGPGLLRLALHGAVAARTFSGQAVAEQLMGPNSTGSAGTVLAC